MGKKKQASAALGKQIIKDRFGKKNKSDVDSFLHTSDLKDGYEWGRLNLQSVTEQNNLEEFLSTAELAGTEFTAEKLNVKFVTSDAYGGIPQGEDLKKIHGLHREHQKLLRIPRRPPWHKEMSASRLDQLEREAFLEWRRSLASLQDVDSLVMTPYEKNLDFWRQLWRVIERSDIVVQIVDARNPLLFYCPDLEQYVQEIDKKKVCLLLINKADFLNQTQRDLWAQHFAKKGVRIAFWSALEEVNRQEKQDGIDSKDTEMDQDVEKSDDNDSSDEDDDDDGDGDDNKKDDIVKAACDYNANDRETVNERLASGDYKTDDDIDDGLVDKYGNKISAPKSGNTVQETENVVGNTDQILTVFEHGSGDDDVNMNRMDTDICYNVDTKDSETLAEFNDTQIQVAGASFQEDSKMCSNCETELTSESKTCQNSKTECVHDTSDRHSCDIQNSGHIYLGPELLELFRSLHTERKVQKDITTVGMVGYPNVGKSSTINAILRMKKVPVSATPGRTKHFQTLFVDPELMLCDCPGLVFPSFVTTKADLVVSGILPVDQMRDHVPPTSLVCQLISRPILERTYGIIIPPPGEAEDPSRPPTAYELLNSYGAMRGFMTARGVPDCPRSSRYILKDYVNGKLLYCHPPPDCDPLTFNYIQTDDGFGAGDVLKQVMDVDSDVPVPSQVDKDFFRKVDSTIHSRTARGGVVGSASSGSQGSPHSSQASLSGKSWKRHNNRNKKEKLRRVYGHLDN